MKQKITPTYSKTIISKCKNRRKFQYFQTTFPTNHSILHINSQCLFCLIVDIRGEFVILNGFHV